MKGKKKEKKKGQKQTRERESIQMVENVSSTFELEFPGTIQGL